MALSHVLRGDPAGSALLPASRCTWVVCNSRPGNELLAFQELHDRRLTLVEGRCDTPLRDLHPVQRHCSQPCASRGGRNANYMQACHFVKPVRL